MLKTRSVNDDLVHIFYVIMDLEVNQSGQLRNPGLKMAVTWEQPGKVII